MRHPFPPAYNRLACGAGVVALALLRLAHSGLLWSDEDYHLAAAFQILQGRIPYAGFWYDKPPMAALFYTVIDAQAGWLLRLWDAAFVVVCCWFAYRLARVLWSEREGYAALLLLAFFMAFYLPSATIPFAVDALLLLPHLAAVYYAQQKRAGRSGACCALGILTNVKGLLVAVVCLVWCGGAWLAFAAGLALPLILAAGWGAWLGVLPEFYRQVWQWGLIYARGSADNNAAGDGLRRVADWLAFHAALALGAVTAFIALERRRMLLFALWLGASFLAILPGNHFAPRYFLQLLPALTILGARGLVLLWDRQSRVLQAVLLALLALPLARFGPRYLTLAIGQAQHRETRWADAAMDVDSRQAADAINALQRPGDTLFVWGYRPDIYVYTRLMAPGKFWDSQPLDGVPADRHLHSGQAILGGAARENRREFVQGAKPVFVVDGLGLLNPALEPARFPELAAWLKDYRLIHQTRLSRIYRLTAEPR